MILTNIHNIMFQILTKDSVTVFVNAIMFYKVRDPISAVSNVDDYSASARLLSATTLRNVLGTKSLKEILSDRETIARDMQELLFEATEPWGVDVERVEVKGKVEDNDMNDDVKENICRCQSSRTVDESHGS